MGSVVTDVELKPTVRPYQGVYDYCLFKNENRCGACIKSCPVGALSAEGKNHQTCISNGALNIGPAFINWGYHSCGHCQNNLPCSNQIPPSRVKTK
jgi:epoxyqueuosine reductase QueG